MQLRSDGTQQSFYGLPDSLFSTMGDLFDRCQAEYGRLRPLCEEAAGVDLGHVMLMDIRSYLDKLDDAGVLTLERELSIVMGACQYWPAEVAGVDFDAIMVNEDALGKRAFLPAFVMAHELSHAAHDALAPGYFSPENADGLWYTLVEGFAAYFQTEMMALGESELERFTAEMRQAMLLSHGTRELNALTSQWTGPWHKIEGYAFFSRAAELAGTKDIVFDILADPPADLAEFNDAESYLSRIAAAGTSAGAGSGGA